MAPPWKILQVNQEVMVGTIQQIGQTIVSLNDAVTTANSNAAAANSNAAAVATNLADISARLNVWKVAVAAGQYVWDQPVAFDPSTVSTFGTVWTLASNSIDVVCNAGGHYSFSVIFSINVSPGSLYLHRNGDTIAFLPVVINVSAGDQIRIHS